MAYTYSDRRMRSHYSYAFLLAYLPNIPGNTNRPPLVISLMYVCALQYYCVGVPIGLVQDFQFLLNQIEDD